MAQGFIFDFNGTMVFDLGIQRDTWKQFVRRQWDRPVTKQEVQTVIMGNNNRAILTHFTPNALSDQEYEELSEQKEALYREMSRRRNSRLAPGLPKLLDKLTKAGYPLNIASSSVWSNIEFYFEQYRLSQWFDIHNVVYDDGIIPQKPDPAMYRAACERIGLKPEVCVVFEDSPIGIQAAVEAKVMEIIQIASKNAEPINDTRANAIVRNYRELLARW